MPGKGSKKAKKSGSNIFTLFSQKQIQEFKEAFGIIDVDKDGIITANDLKAAFVSIGRPISDAEANNLVGEAPGPINFTQERRRGITRLIFENLCCDSYQPTNQQTKPTN